LAAGGGGQAVHPRDHDLRHRLDRAHHVGAHAQQVAGSGEVAGGDVGEVVPGTEHRAGPGQHDARRVGRRRLQERREQVGEMVDRQRVAPLRPVHRDGDGVVLPVDEDVLVSTHGIYATARPRPAPDDGFSRRRAIRRSGRG
jgi:hypothetical protein